MSIPYFVVGVFGVGFALYLGAIFFSTFWEMKPLKGVLWVLGLLGIMSLGTVSFTFIKSGFLLPIVFVVMAFLLTQYFQASITSKVLFAVIFSALLAISEMLVAVTSILVLNYSAEQVQNDFIAYTVGLFASRLFAFFLIYLIRFIIKSKNREFDKWFNLLLLLLPMQSLALCVVVYGIATVTTDVRINSLNIFALLISFSFLVITAFILKKQSEAVEYKQKFELASIRLQAQLEQYDELYKAGQEIRGIKHDIQNTLIAIAGLLSEGKTQDAIEHIEKIQSNIRLTDMPANTGHPTIDAIINAKIKRASEENINIKHTVMLGEVFVDQVDIAIVLANALDNAIEAVAKSDNVDRDIYIIMSNRSDYISIEVENYTFEILDRSLKTTKADKPSHGFGIKQMKAIAEKYSGDLTAFFDLKTQKFHLKILLKNYKV